MSFVVSNRAIQIMLGLLVVIAALSLVFFFSYFGDRGYADPVSFKVLDEGSESSFYERKNFIIRSEAEWKDLWSQIHTENSSMPQVDFTTNVVLALFQGQKPSGGYELTVGSIVFVDNLVEVSIVEKEPGVGCAVSEALTAPYQLVVVEKFEGSILSNTERILVPCTL